MTEEALHSPDRRDLRCGARAGAADELLQQAARLTGSTAAMLDVVSPGRAVLDKQVLGADPAYRAIAAYYHQHNLVVRRAHLGCEGRAILGQDMVRLEEWQGNSNFHEVLVPAKTVHLLSMPF